jgi:hypothetical protein
MMLGLVPGIPGSGRDGTVKLADFEAEFGNNPALEPVSQTLKAVWTKSL